jgi:ATP-dependent exoDNAse (exonuclease V) beta subunit
MGLFGESLEDASGRVEQSLRRVLEDAVGRWILSPDHLQAESEFALTWVDEEGRLSDIIIDRTFVDRETNERWLVDYKNSLPADGESLEVFAQREANTYREQLVEYRDVLAQLGDQPVNCALYFTAVAHLQLVDAQEPRV